uniref:Single domain-containing protein n=1 Tax=Timema cristinae TaxID=61476 RepID=A0A7R9CB80_TIMCR|nr:unnamed protein product [Timema cristinae]
MGLGLRGEGEKESQQPIRERWDVVTCKPLFFKEPHCNLVGMNNTLPYPQCCPHYDCTKDVYSSKGTHSVYIQKVPVERLLCSLVLALLLVLPQDRLPHLLLDLWAVRRLYRCVAP